MATSAKKRRRLGGTESFGGAGAKGWRVAASKL